MTTTGSSNGKITTLHIIVPMAVMALTMALAFASQVSQVMRERDTLNRVIGSLEDPVAQSDRVTKQFGGLVSGTRKLADEGDPTAKEFVDRLKTLGVVVDSPAAQGAPTPIPGADAPPAQEPMKP